MTELRALCCDDQFPVRNDIPVMLADPHQRGRVDVSRIGRNGRDALSFYNDPAHHDDYCREALETIRIELAQWLPCTTASGPVAEIGSGKGPLQGTGGDYIAVDYSFTALSRFIDPRHGRVCASAVRLPFPAKSFRFVFSIAALEHVPEAEDAFAEIDRVLSSGGVAYLWPAWHCVQYNCDGIPVRPYTDLTWGQRFVKASLPVRRLRITKAAAALPQRIVRRAVWAINRRAEPLRFRPLRPNYHTFWTSDSDAAARIDSHEGCLFFKARGYEILQPGPGLLAQLSFGHRALVVRKPSARARREYQ